MLVEDFVKSVLKESKKKKYTQVRLSFGKKGLDPVMSEDTINYHYGELYKGYVDKSNKREGGKFQVAGAFLHEIFFSQFKSPRGPNKPEGSFKELVESKYKTYEDFKEKVKESAMAIQGSGWVYVDSKGSIKTIENHEVRKDIILLIDWWEHAWALDYQSNKEKYLDNIYKIIDWEKINSRLATK